MSCDLVIQADVKGKSAIVQRGRFGDIINILPMARILWEQTGEPPVVFVESPLTSLLDGVTYATAGSLNAVNTTERAIGEVLNNRFERVYMTTVSGTGINYQRRCESFTKESWDRAGMLGYWGTAPLIFDNRDAAREKALIQTVKLTLAPTILVNCSGCSSPYPYWEKLWRELRWHFGGCNLIDLAIVKAVAFQDLLGLFDLADVLITIDTGTLHLAAASQIKVAALITDRPTLWHGAIPHRQPEMQMRYEESRVRMDELFRWLDNVLRRPTCRTIHLFSDYAQQRRSIAHETWVRFYRTRKLVPFPIADEQMPRLHHDGKRQLPFVKDMIQFAFSRGYESLLLTNSDTCLAPVLETVVLELRGAPAWGARRDFKELTQALSQEEVEAGDEYCGADLFYIPREWWRSIQNKFPDMLLGTEGWDCCLREMMRTTGGKEIFNTCYHQRHDSVWERPENRHRLSSQLHNQRLAKEFLRKLGVNPKEHGF